MIDSKSSQDDALSSMNILRNILVLVDRFKTIISSCVNKTWNLRIKLDEFIINFIVLYQ